MKNMLIFVKRLHGKGIRGVIWSNPKRHLSKDCCSPFRGFHLCKVKKNALFSNLSNRDKNNGVPPFPSFFGHVVGLHHFHHGVNTIQVVAFFQTSSVSVSQEDPTKPVGPSPYNIDIILSRPIPGNVVVAMLCIYFMFFFFLISKCHCNENEPF